MKGLHTRLWQWTTDWLTADADPQVVLLCDFQRLSSELKPGDVLLVEGRSRVAQSIKLITQSAWTHAALYVGRLHDIEAPGLRNLMVQYYQRDHSEQLLVETVLGEGTRVSPLSKYRHDHLRLCRPEGLSAADAQMVIESRDLQRPGPFLQRSLQPGVGHVTRLRRRGKGHPCQGHFGARIAGGIRPMSTLPLFLLALIGMLAATLTVPALRQRVITKRLLRSFRRVMPAMSRTEQEALEAGGVWWDGEIFSGRPRWQRLLDLPAAQLSDEEQAFLSGPVERLCRDLDDWRISRQNLDLPSEIWDFIRRERFFGMVIPRTYGGLGFSHLAHSEVVIDRKSTRLNSSHSSPSRMPSSA